MIRIGDAVSCHRHIHHFGKDAAEAPDVNGLAVVPIKDYYLRRAIPPRADVVRESALRANHL